MWLPSHRPSLPLENKTADRKGFCPSCFFPFAMFHPHFSDIATLPPLAPFGFAVPYKNYPLLFSGSAVKWLVFSCLPSVFLVPPFVLEPRDRFALFPKIFPFFAKNDRDKLCSPLSLQKKLRRANPTSCCFTRPSSKKALNLLLHQTKRRRFSWLCLID